MQSQEQEKPIEKLDKRELVAEVNAIREKNFHVITELKHLFKQADQEKSQRDEQNAAVKKIAGELEKIRSELKETEAKLIPLEKEVYAFNGPSPEMLKSEIQTLEYSLHVAYSPSREKIVGRQIKELSKQLKTIAALAPKRLELTAIRTKFRELRKNLSTQVRELKTRAAKSEEHHEKMLSFFKEANELRKILPDSFTELDEKRELLDQISAEQREQWQKEKQEFDSRRRKEKQEFDAQRQVVKAEQGKRMETVKAKAQEILEKFKLGQPISFDELQVLQAAGVEI